MRTVGELFHSVDKEAALAALYSYYGNQRGQDIGYREAWDTIMRLQPKSGAGYTCFVSIAKGCMCGDCGEANEWVDVSGYKNGNFYAMEYTSWEEWLAMDVHITEPLQGLEDHEVVAHILYEMTWAGYDQTTINKRLDHISEICGEAMEVLAAEANKPRTLH